MNTFALILAAAAIVVFLVNAVKKWTRPWQLPLGLALFVAAVAVQFVFVHGPSFTH